jgi:hypothetical protein
MVQDVSVTFKPLLHICQRAQVLSICQRPINALNEHSNPQCIRYINQSLREPKKPRDESPDMTVATQEQVDITVLREAQAKQSNAASADPCDKKGLSVMLYTKRGVYRQ